MKKRLFQILQFLLFLGIGVGILYLVYRHQNAAFLSDCQQRGIPPENCNLLQKLLSDFAHADFGWIALVLVAFVISNVNRSIKWLMLLRPLGYSPRFRNAFLSILVGYFANLGLPRMGEVVRAGILARYEHIPAQKVMGTIVTDRLVDLVCMALSLGLALLFEFEKIRDYFGSGWQELTAGANSRSTWLIIVALVAVPAALVYTFRHQLKRTTLYQRLLSLLYGFYEGIMSIRKVERPGWFIFHSLSIWVLYFVMTWLGFKAFEPTSHLGIGAALTVFVFGTLGMVIPSPGGLGTFHALVIAALTLFYDVRGDDAFSVANIIFFSISIGFNALLGIMALLLLPIVNRNYQPTHLTHQSHMP